MCLRFLAERLLDLLLIIKCIFFFSEAMEFQCVTSTSPCHILLLNMFMMPSTLWMYPSKGIHLMQV